MKEYDIYLNKRPLEIDLTIYNLNFNDTMRVSLGLAIGSQANISATQDFIVSEGLALTTTHSGAPMIEAPLDISTGFSVQSNASPTLVNDLGAVSHGFSIGHNASIARESAFDALLSLGIDSNVLGLQPGKSTGSLENILRLGACDLEAVNTEEFLTVNATIGVGGSLSGVIMDVDEPMQVGFCLGASLPKLSRSEPFAVEEGMSIDTSSRPLTPGYALGRGTAAIGVGSAVDISIDGTEQQQQ